MGYLRAVSTFRSGGGGGGQTLDWQIDREEVADYNENDVVLTFSQTPLSPSSVIVNLNNGLLTQGVDYDIVGNTVVILFDKADDGQDHFFTAQYPYNA